MYTYFVMVYMCLVQTLSLLHPFLKADPSPEADRDLGRDKIHLDFCIIRRPLPKF